MSTYEAFDVLLNRINHLEIPLVWVDNQISIRGDLLLWRTLVQFVSHVRNAS